MEQIILVGHLLVALAIIALIMLQQGKGADMGASFGAGGSQTLFGSDGSGNVLTRATSWLVMLFFVSSFSLALLANDIAFDEPTFALFGWRRGRIERRAFHLTGGVTPLIEPGAEPDTGEPVGESCGRVTKPDQGDER